ncbi:MAG TPA: alkene reductase [Stellaceae bacterium]
MSRSDTDLFEPVQAGRYRLRNRLIMAAMTRNRSPGEIPGDLNVDYYGQRATAGLIVAESTAISEQGIGWRDTPGIYTDAMIAGWRRVTDAIHRNGGRTFLQLWHCGRCSHPDWRPDGSHPVAPSAVQSIGGMTTANGRQQHAMPRALELHELPGIVDQYRQATVNALAAGFDGVEVHAGNGYLIDQFLQDASNRRTDHYGGSIENRCRLLWEVLDAVIGVAGADRVGIHISPTNVHHGISDGDPEKLFAVVVDRLNGYGLAYLNVVEGATDPTETEIPFDWQALRRRYRGIYIANNNYDLARAIEALRQDHADLFSFGRLYIANPDLVARFREGAPLNPLHIPGIIAEGPVGYTDYPSLGD